MTTTDTERSIMRFSGAFSYLSNFYPSPVVTGDGFTYPTAEHAFQAAKTIDAKQRARICSAPTPGEAKSAGGSVRLRPGWDGMRKRVMLRVVQVKFSPDTELAGWLCATGESLLVEGNTWHDQYWGDCNCGRGACSGPGNNYLGRILMAVRMTLQED